jgi:ribosomal protein L17
MGNVNVDASKAINPLLAGLLTNAVYLRLILKELKKQDDVTEEQAALGAVKLHTALWKMVEEIGEDFKSRPRP